MQSSRRDISLQKSIINSVHDVSAMDISLPTTGTFMNNRYSGVRIRTASVGRLRANDESTEKSDISLVNTQNTITSGAIAHRDVRISVVIHINGLVIKPHFL